MVVSTCVGLLHPYMARVRDASSELEIELLFFGSCCVLGAS